MKPRSGILAGGNWIVDKLKLIDTWPQQDALANILTESVGNGGGPFNVLVDLARLGASFRLAGVGLIGADADGQWISAECARHCINSSQVQTHPIAPTSYTDVMTVKATGRRTFFHQRGANAFLGDEHFDFSQTSAKIFHLAYLLLLDRIDQSDKAFGTVAARILQRAGKAGCQTSIDVVSEDSYRFKEIVLPTLPFVDYCFLNEFEIERTTGIEVQQKQGINLDALKTAAHQLIQTGVRKWVIVHFPEGAYALGHDGQLHIQRSLDIPPQKIVGTVGAGDAFAAGVLYGLHEEQPIETALHYGVCAAASCLAGAGASDGVGCLKDCLALEKTYGVRASGW
jgi:sugar/nucleoside kinase (ribokinase family)